MYHASMLSQPMDMSFAFVYKTTIALNDNTIHGTCTTTLCTSKTNFSYSLGVSHIIIAPLLTLYSFRNGKMYFLYLPTAQMKLNPTFRCMRRRRDSHAANSLHNRSSPRYCTPETTINFSPRVTTNFHSPVTLHCRSNLPPRRGWCCAIGQRTSDPRSDRASCRASRGNCFYLDLLGASHDETIQRALDELGRYTSVLRVLGSYARFSE